MTSLAPVAQDDRVLEGDGGVCRRIEPICRIFRCKLATSHCMPLCRSRRLDSRDLQGRDLAMRLPWPRNRGAFCKARFATRGQCRVRAPPYALSNCWHRRSPERMTHPLREGDRRASVRQSTAPHLGGVDPNLRRTRATPRLACGVAADVQPAGRGAIGGPGAVYGLPSGSRATLRIAEENGGPEGHVHLTGTDSSRRQRRRLRRSQCCRDRNQGEQARRSSPEPSTSVAKSIHQPATGGSASRPKRATRRRARVEAGRKVGRDRHRRSRRWRSQPGGGRLHTRWIAH